MKLLSREPSRVRVVLARVELVRSILEARITGDASDDEPVLAFGFPARHEPTEPSLAELIARPEQAEHVAPAAIPALLGELRRLEAYLWARLATGGARSENRPEPDRLVGVAEAAAMLGLSRDYLYRNAKRLPFIVREGRALRFSLSGIQRHIARRMGR